jgi:hypothetical protein
LEGVARSDHGGDSFFTDEVDPVVYRERSRPNRMAKVIGVSLFAGFDIEAKNSSASIDEVAVSSMSDRGRKPAGCTFRTPKIASLPTGVGLFNTDKSIGGDGFLRGATLAPRRRAYEQVTGFE